MAQQRGSEIIPFDNWNMGGLSDSMWSGKPNSAYKLTGWDLHKIPGIARVAQKLTQVTAADMDELCYASVSSTNGHTYYFSYESGKIWMRHGTTGVVSLVHTTTPSVGHAECLGAYEYQGTIYWATENKLHQIPSINATTSGDWATYVVEDWATFKNGDLLFHPMREQNLALYIGDANSLAQVDAGTFSQEAIDIKQPLRIKSLGKIGTDILIGTYVSDTVTKTELVRWNTVSGTFQVSNQVDEVGINAFLQTDSLVYVQAGLWGRIYVYDYNSNRLSSFKTVPGDYSPTAYSTTNPDAVGTINGIALFGVSNVLGNPCDQGVYAIGRYSGSYPYIIDMPYPLSPRDGDEFVLSGIEIGTICVSGFDVFVQWKRTDADNNVTVGLDKLDYSTKLNGAYLESRIMSNNRSEFANFDKFLVAYALMPSGCSIEISYSKNYGSFVPTTEKVDTDRNIVYAESSRLEATTLRMRIKVVTSGNLGPELESAGVKLV